MPSRTERRELEAKTLRADRILMEKRIARGETPSMVPPKSKRR